MNFAFAVDKLNNLIMVYFWFSAKTSLFCLLVTILSIKKNSYFLTIKMKTKKFYDVLKFLLLFIGKKKFHKTKTTFIDNYKLKKFEFYFFLLCNHLN
jgi:hypothetical protein